MTHLDTKFPTIVFNNFPLIDPCMIKEIMGKRTKNRERIEFYYKETPILPKIQFVVNIASGFLNMYDFNHHKDIWYIDCIRYKLENQTKPVKSGLAWHCENDNYDNLITVLFYLRKDDGIKNGNLGYKDKDNKKHIIEINSGTTIIMDGRVPHKPKNPIGTGKRDVIIVSFKKID